MGKGMEEGLGTGMETEEVTVSDFRKKLFTFADQALKGDLVEFIYKGQKIRLVPERTGSKLSRLPVLDVLVGEPEEIDQALANLSEESERRWLDRER